MNVGERGAAIELLAAARLSHEADTPGLPRERAEAAADLDPELLEKEAAGRLLFLAAGEGRRGELRQAIPLRGQEFEATPSIAGGKLVLTPTQSSIPRLSIDLPKIVDGITYREVQIEDDTATLSFTLRNATFKINRG